MLSQTSLYPLIGQPFIVLPSIDSSNNYAMAQVHDGLAKHGHTFFTLEQTAGKGQRGKQWNALPGMNILMSVVIEPKRITIKNMFHLSALVSLACYDFIKKYAGDSVTIKWPNDIYWNDRKAGGILIENVLRGSNWMFAIAGIGININQLEFGPGSPNAVSLHQITGHTIAVIDSAMELCVMMEKRCKHPQSQLLADYNDVLYKKDQPVKLKKGNIVFESIIKAVNEEGMLLTQDAIERTFQFGEIQWLRSN